MGQNCLVGKHGTPKIQPSNKGARRLLVEVENDLAIKIRKLGGKAALGGYTVSTHISN